MFIDRLISFPIPLILKYDEKMSASKMRFISNSLKILLLPQRLRSRS